jgi:DNA-binding CsgD family transcriptional regulator/tetratricopeptide (TPR) repeat protein
MGVNPTASKNSRRQVIGQPVACAVFVGRQDELAALTESRRALSRSHGSVVLLGGEAGIGKSRLLAQFVRQSSEGRARTLVGAECLEQAQAPFGPIRSLARALHAKVPLADLPPNVLRALAQVGSDVRSDNGTRLEKAELFGALLAFVKLACAKRATVFTIEDLHWADQSTLEFLSYLTPRIGATRLMVVATYRTEEVEGNPPLLDAMSRMLRESSTRRIVLEPFTTSEVRALLAGALEGRPHPPQSTIADIERRCEGNPFFAEELVKDALERGGSPGSSLPISIRASILQRLSVLSDEDRRVLAYAAVLGPRFDPSLLALAMQRHVDDVLPALRRARDLNILAEERSPAGRCHFRHALTRQTIYDDMLAFDTRRLHERMVLTLESFTDAEDRVEELAYHAWEAKDAGRTIRYSERAGEVALTLRALAEAGASFERALSAASDDVDKARLLEQIASVAAMQGELERAAELLESSLAIRRKRSEFGDAARIVGLIIGHRSNLGESHDVTIARAEAFLAEHAAVLPDAARDRLGALAARLASAAYDFDRMERLLANVSPPESLAPRVRLNYDVAQLNRLAFIGDVAGWQRVANDHHDRVSSAPPLFAVISLAAIAQSGTYLGANREVERALAEAESTIVEWDFGAIDSFVAAVRGVYLWLRGNVQGARAALERALERPEIVVAQCVVSAVGPLVARALGDDALAERCLAAGMVQDGKGPDGALMLGARGAWFAFRGRLHAAQTDLNAAIGELRTAPPACSPLLIAAAQYLPPRDLPRLRALCDETALHPANAPGRATAALVAAILAQRDGEDASAIRRAEDAVQGYSALGWPLFEAQALEIAGRAPEALLRYERCGAVEDARRLSPASAITSEVDGGQRLSSREREVASLVTIGLTNTEIAERLSVSDKTVEKHLSSIFTKLGLRSRAQVAAFIGREGAAGLRRSDEGARALV